MKAKTLILDFINYAFLLILISFCVLFFTVGDNFFMFGRFLKIILPFSVFGIFFLINLKKQRNSIIKFNDEGVLDEIIGYFSDQDRLKDIIVITSLPIIILSISIINKNIVILDLVQALLSFFYMFLWHKILFRNQDNTTKIIYLKNIDKIKDEIAIYFLPFFIAGLGMFKIEINIIVDIFQGLACFVIILGWHYLLFRDRN